MDIGQRATATVIVVDDDPGIRDSLRMVLEDAGFEVALFASAEEYLAAHPVNASIRDPGGRILLLDLRMTGMSGLELLERLRAHRVQTPAIMITGHGDVDAAVRSLKLGAADFVEKPVKNQELIGRLHQVLALDRDRRLRQQVGDVARARLAGLSPREREILQMLVAGNSTKQVAHELSLSFRTVENHRAHILTKTGAENIADLVRLAILAERQ